jgi:hypothetical protein
MSQHQDHDILDVIHEFLQTDQAFYGILRFLDSSTRNHIVAAHMRNNANLIGLLRQYMAQSPITNMVLNIPIRTDISGNFFDNVPVLPTQEQIMAATEQHVGVRDTTCSICQESVECATRIRACGHCFHSECISQWFTMNTRCPMCRYDIRRRHTELSNESRGLHSNQES